jgi:copper chaperone NosL
MVVGCAALLMSAAYALPLWRIELVAPQYPEGLGMLIGVDEIRGLKDGDLQSINGLNHYIGMKAIEPDAIAELRYMPVILGLLIASGLVVATAGRRRLFTGWAIALGVVLAAGAADYWKWGHEYGHDLDPRAIIRIPGMTYQPPFVGSRKLLNFTATSWPAPGGWALIGAAVVVAGALIITIRRRSLTGTVGTLSLAAAACGSPGAKAIVVGVDTCENCHMTIADVRFGAQVITAKGRVHTFDSVECLVEWLGEAGRGDGSTAYVVDMQHPGTIVAADSAGFLAGMLVHGPMGRSIGAFATLDDAEAQRAMLGGSVSTWSSIRSGATMPEPVDR